MIDQKCVCLALVLGLASLSAPVLAETASPISGPVLSGPTTPGLVVILPAPLAAVAEVQGPEILSPEILRPENLTPETLSLEELDAMAAGADTHVDVITDQQLNAVNSGNTINAGSIINGDISLTSGALSGYAGVGNFVMNTGNNNNLQGTISVTVVNTSDLAR